MEQLIWNWRTARTWYYSGYPVQTIKNVFNLPTTNGLPSISLSEWPFHNVLAALSQTLTTNSPWLRQYIRRSRANCSFYFWFWARSSLSLGDPALKWNQVRHHRACIRTSLRSTRFVWSSRSRMRLVLIEESLNQDGYSIIPCQRTLSSHHIQCPSLTPSTWSSSFPSSE